MGHYNIQAAAKISGVSDACIRAWEKRYNSIIPARDESNHRLYSEQEIERLILFNKLTSIGMRIKKLSSLPTEELKAIYQSVTKEKLTENRLQSQPAESSIYQSLYIIEESFNAKRFDVAYHELKKVMDTCPIKDIALKFIPALEGLCQNWKIKNTIDPEQIMAFEKLIGHWGNQVSHRESHNFRDLKSITVSLDSSYNQITDSSIEMLLASHRVENCMFSNESNVDFLLVLIKVIKPQYVFVVAEHTHSEILRLNEALGVESTTKIVILDQKLSLLKKTGPDSKTGQVFNSILEVDQFLDQVH